MRKYLQLKVKNEKLKVNVYLFALFTFHFSLFTSVAAQNNFSVAFKDAASSPRNLIVCGNETNVTVRITNTSLDASTLSNISTRLQLFRGVQLVSFNAGQSSAGITLTDNNKFSPSFSISSLSAGNPVYISYTIRANCDYTDTLSKNNLLDVSDTWNFNFTKGTQNNLTEKATSTQYRDQLRIPYLTMFVSNNAGANSHVGGLYQRTVKINNSSIGAWLKSLLYTNTQGSGVSVLAVKVNGTPVNFIKTPKGGGTLDSLISYEIKGNLFLNNTGTLNNDTLFDANETVTITEDLLLLSCSASRSSNHTASWGCDGSYCNTISATDLVKKSEGSVSVGFVSNPNGTDIIGGYCKSGRASVIFRNNGVEIDTGAATMHNIWTGIGVGNYLKSTNGYVITALRIAGKNIPLKDTTTTALKNIFTSDPDGVGVGLTDADGDGIFDDLPIGKSFLVEVDYDVACSFNNPTDKQCFNNFSTGLSAIIQYGDNCNLSNTDAHPGFFSPYNGNSLVENCSDPDCSTNSKYFMVQHMERRSIFNFSKNCNGQEQFQVKVTLPHGIQPIKDSMFLLRFTDTLKQISYTRIADTAIILFDAHTASQINGDYFVKMGFYADCTASAELLALKNDSTTARKNLISQSAQLLFPTQFAFICPPCSCTHVWYCDSVIGPRLHYSNPPCPIIPALDCQKGLNTVFFAVNRTTLGYADSTFTNLISAQKANLKVAMPCDSVNMVLRSVVGNTSIVDSLGIRIGYDNIIRNDTNKLKDIFIFDKGTVNLWHNGASNICKLTQADVKYVRTDTTKFMYFDLNACLLSKGITLVKGDSVLFDGNFSVNRDAPIDFTYQKIHNFRAYSYFTDAAQDWWCEDYGETFRVGRQEILFNSPSSYSYPQGCALTELHYQLIVRNNDYEKYFGKEVRQVIKIDSLVFQMDTSLYRAFTTAISVSIPGQPFYQDSFKILKPFDNSGKYIAKFDTLAAFQTLGKIGNNVFDFRIKVQPNCRSLIGSTSSNNQYLFAPNMYYRDNFYASHFGNGSCSVQKRDTARSFDKYLTYTNVPELSLTPLTNLSAVTSNDTATWTIKVCNNSTKGAANQIWFSVVPLSSTQNGGTVGGVSAFKIISFEDITNPLAIDNLTIQYTAEDSSSAYIFGNGLSTNSPGKNLNDYCDIIRIKAVSTECNSIPLKFTCGWFCQTPGNKIVDDILSDNCNNQILDAKVNLTIPFVEAAYSNQTLVKPGICDTTMLEVLVKNTDLGTLYDLRSQITIPLQGATLLPNSVQIAYPATGAFKNVIAAPQLLFTSPKGKTYQFANFAPLDNFLNTHGLQGFNPQTPNDSNQFRIRYRFTNDCGFQSGSLSYFAFQGKTSCGVNSNTQLGESLPLQIDGAVLDTQKLYLVSFKPNSKFSPGTESYIELRIRNLTSQPSDSREKVTVKLPSYITIVPNSSVGTSPESWAITEPTTEIIDAYKNVSWQMPQGLKLNEEAILRFKVIAPDTMTCNGGTRSISLVTIIQKALLCTKSQAVCTASIITTSNGEQFYEIPVGSDSIKIVSSVPANGNYVKINSGTAVRLSNADGLSVVWSDSTTNLVLSRDSFINLKPTKKLTVVKATADGSKCIAPAYFSVERADTIAKLTFIISIPDTTVDCAANLPINQPVISPNPNAAVNFTKTDVESVVFCGRKIKRTWSTSFVDANGGQQNLSVAQNITQVDKIAPTITPKNPLLSGLHSGDTLTFNCINPPIFNVEDMIYKDNCDVNPKSKFTDIAIKKGICVIDGYAILMHCAWIATDVCGNTAQFDIFIKIIDNTQPSLLNVPADTTITSVSVIPDAPTNILAVDGCDNKPVVVLNETKTDTLVKRTWTATDACGNFKAATQNIKILSVRKVDTTVDRLAPQIFINNGISLDLWTGVDTTFKINCETNFSITKANLIATDNIDKSPLITIDSIINLASNCATAGFFLQKTYNISAKDSSGNVTNKVAKLFFVDSSPPVILSILNDTIINRQGTLLYAPIPPNATDNCSSITTTYKIERDAIIGSDTLWLVNWTVVDACGNASYISQKVTQKIPAIIDSTSKQKSCNLFANKSVILNIPAGASTAFYCLPILLDSISQFTILDNGTPYNTRLTQCDTSGHAGMPIGMGAHVFNFSNSTQRCVDSFSINIVPKVDTPQIPGIKPIAINDTSKTHLGVPIIIFALRNDKNVTNKSTLEIVSLPTRGIAEVVQLDFEPAIKYTPDALKCSYTNPDVFIYRVCNASPTGAKNCDLANIYITNGCGKLIVYNGFSPNGDGVNDYFTVEGIEDFPETQVTIFNRWGNEVYTSPDYKNNWNGNWNNKNLPDGTYFYRVGLKDGGSFSGYVQITR